MKNSNSFSQHQKMSWLIWSAAGLFYLYEFIHRVLPGLIVSELMQSLTISSVSVGVISAAYYYSYALMQIPVGILLDRYSIRLQLGTAAVIVAIGSYLLSTAQTPTVAILSRVLIGVGSAFSFVGCLKIASIWFPENRFSLIVGLTNMLGVSGAIIGGEPIAQLVEASGWRHTMFLCSVASIICASVIFIFVKDAKQPKPNRTDEKKPTKSIFYSIKHSTNNFNIWYFSLIAALMVVPIATYSELWGPTFIMLQYGLSKPEAAGMVTLTFLGIGIGGPTIGFIADKFKYKVVSVLIGSALALVNIYLLLYVHLDSFYLLGLVHIMLGFCTSSMLVIFTINSQSSSQRCKATTIAVTNMAIMAFSTIFQPLTGLLLDQINTSNNYTPDAIQYALSPMLLCSITATTLLLFKIRHISK